MSRSHSIQPLAGRQALLAGLALMGASVPWTATAQLATENYIEVQIDAARLDALLRAELQSREICPVSFLCPIGD